MNACVRACLQICMRAYMQVHARMHACTRARAHAACIHAWSRSRMPLRLLLYLQRARKVLEGEAAGGARRARGATARQRGTLADVSAGQQRILVEDVSS